MKQILPDLRCKGMHDHVVLSVPIAMESAGDNIYLCIYWSSMTIPC